MRGLHGTPVVRWSLRVAAPLVLAILAVTLAPATPPACAAGSGCTRIENADPGYDAEGFPVCRPGTGPCYNCEYSTSSGYLICAEDVDGDTICLESETLPRRAQNRTS